MYVIHYHGTPFSGGDLNHTALAGRHAMVSYAHNSHISTIAEVCSTFCIDNGAFSDWKSGSPRCDAIEWDDYIEWANGWLIHPGCDFAVAPDIIDGSEADNNAVLRGVSGSQWVPVWHMHESIDRLARLCDEWDRVALGSSGEFADVGTRKWWDRMCVAMEQVTDDDGFPFAKLHGLRMLDPGIFSYLPLSSADSTNVARNIGIDIRWTGPYVPKTAKTRALVMMDRIETHACAARWQKGFMVKQANFDLIG